MTTTENPLSEEDNEERSRHWVYLRQNMRVLTMAWVAGLTEQTKKALALRFTMEKLTSSRPPSIVQLHREICFMVQDHPSHALENEMWALQEILTDWGVGPVPVQGRLYDVELTTRVLVWAFDEDDAKSGAIKAMRARGDNFDADVCLVTEESEVADMLDDYVWAGPRLRNHYEEVPDLTVRETLQLNEQLPVPEPREVTSKEVWDAHHSDDDDED